MKEKFVNFYMKVAEDAAQLSYANRLKVGCVIVKNDNILSFAYNGSPAGWDNCCETSEVVTRNGIVVIELKTKPEVLHAEENAILKLAREGKSGKGSSMFCTHAPCIHCARMIGGAGINTLYYKTVYRDDSGIEYLKKYGTEIVHYS